MNIIEVFLKTSILVQITIITLMIFSIVSWSIIFHRIVMIRIAQYHLKLFEKKFWSGVELPNLYKEISSRRNRLNSSEYIFYAGFKEFSQLNQIKNCSPGIIIKRTLRIMHNTMNIELEELENYIPIIGTIGSISPYVGLFGTILGIIHVFLELDSITPNQAKHIQIIAPGVAEALISTAIGLFVAIPAVIAFNYLVVKISSLNQNYNNFIEEFITILNHQIFLNTDFN